MPATVSSKEMERHTKREKHEPKGKGKGRMHRMEIEHAENGGFIATHHMKSGMHDGYIEPKKHALKNGAALVKHVKEHCCDPSDISESAEGTGMPKEK